MHNCDGASVFLRLPFPLPEYLQLLRLSIRVAARWATEPARRRPRTPLVEE